MKTTSSGKVLAEKISKQLKTLPEESLIKVAHYIDALLSDARKTVRKPTTPRNPKHPLRIIKLGGILKGYDFSPELLAQARREMWKKFADLEQ